MIQNNSRKTCGMVASLFKMLMFLSLYIEVAESTVEKFSFKYKSEIDKALTCTRSQPNVAKREIDNLRDQFLRENSVCADCPNKAQMAVVPFGISVCDPCGGVWREIKQDCFEKEIGGSKNASVRYITPSDDRRCDTWHDNLWAPKLKDFKGNNYVNKYLEANMPTGLRRLNGDSPREERKLLLTQKYLLQVYRDLNNGGSLPQTADQVRDAQLSSWKAPTEAQQLAQKYSRVLLPDSPYKGATIGNGYLEAVKVIRKGRGRNSKRYFQLNAIVNKNGSSSVVITKYNKRSKKNTRTGNATGYEVRVVTKKHGVLNVGDQARKMNQCGGNVIVMSSGKGVTVPIKDWESFKLVSPKATQITHYVYSDSSDIFVVSSVTDSEKNGFELSIQCQTRRKAGTTKSHNYRLRFKSVNDKEAFKYFVGELSGRHKMVKGLESKLAARSKHGRTSARFVPTLSRRKPSGSQPATQTTPPPFVLEDELNEVANEIRASRLSEARKGESGRIAFKRRSRRRRLCTSQLMIAKLMDEIRAAQAEFARKQAARRR